MLITLSLLKEWGACWDDEHIAQHLGKRRGLTPRQVAEDETISLADRFWVLCQTLCHLDETRSRLFAIESAAMVSHLAGDEDDQAQYLGLINELYQIELELPTGKRNTVRRAVQVAALEARDMVRAAVWDAPLYAAWDTVWEAAWDTTWDVVRVASRAARDVTRDAAGVGRYRMQDAVWEAAWTAAARDVELRKAIVRVLEWLGRDGGA